MEPRISIIVPVHNVELYLVQCVESSARIDGVKIASGIHIGFVDGDEQHSYL